MIGYRCLPFGPLEAYVARRGPAKSLGLPERSWWRWRSKGRLAIDQAEDIADLLGVHPFDIWGSAYYEVAV